MSIDMNGANDESHSNSNGEVSGDSDDRYNVEFRVLRHHSNRRFASSDSVEGLFADEEVIKY